MILLGAGRGNPLLLSCLTLGAKLPWLWFVLLCESSVGADGMEVGSL